MPFDIVRLFHFLAWCLIGLAAIGLLIVLAIGLTSQDGFEARPPAHYAPVNGQPPDRPLKLL